MWWSSFLTNLHDYSLQSITELKNPPQLLFCKCSERKECSKISKIPVKHLKTASFFLNVTDLQFRISKFNKYRLQENISCECCEISVNLRGKVHNSGILLRFIYTFLKKLLPSFFKGCSEKLLF